MTNTKKHRNNIFQTIFQSKYYNNYTLNNFRNRITVNVHFLYFMNMSKIASGENKISNNLFVFLIFLGAIWHFWSILYTSIAHSDIKHISIYLIIIIIIIYLFLYTVASPRSFPVDLLPLLMFDRRSSPSASSRCCWKQRWSAESLRPAVKLSAVIRCADAFQVGAIYLCYCELYIVFSCVTLKFLCSF